MVLSTIHFLLVMSAPPLDVQHVCPGRFETGLKCFLGMLTVCSLTFENGASGLGCSHVSVKSASAREARSAEDINGTFV